MGVVFVYFRREWCRTQTGGGAGPLPFLPYEKEAGPVIGSRDGTGEVSMSMSMPLEKCVSICVGVASVIFKPYCRLICSSHHYFAQCEALVQVVVFGSRIFIFDAFGAKWS